MSDLEQLSSEYQEILARFGQLNSEYGDTNARLGQLTSEFGEVLARCGQLTSECEEITARLYGGGCRPVSDILDDYETARSLIEEMMSGKRDWGEKARKIKALPDHETLRSQFRGIVERASGCKRLLDSVVSDVNTELPGIVESTYERIRSLIETAGTLEKNLEAGGSMLRDTLERNDESVNSVKGLLDTLVSDMNGQLPGIVKAVYEGTQSFIEEAQTVEKKLEELVEGQALLERLVAFPEHAEHPPLQKALRAFCDYESTLQRALANETVEREEEEFRNAVAGITYTATDKQIRYLIGLGANPRDLDGITKQQASAMINRMKKE